LSVGGLSRDIGDPDCQDALVAVRNSLTRLEELQEMLRLSSTFLDRIEEVGITTRPGALAHGLVGPVARAAGIQRDLRKAQPYCGYDALAFNVPVEEEGDGYARLRVLFAEAKQSVRLMEQAVATLPSGPVAGPQLSQRGAALGWVEAPRGASACWLRIGEDGRVERYRIMPPSFMNWHGFHLAAEKFAFQDFPIILATFDLSVTENDR
jgi:formate hydrogenlyase subunit 5